MGDAEAAAAAAATPAREADARTCEEHEEHGHQQHVVHEQRCQAVATAAFHVSRPSNLFLPPAIVLDDPFVVPRMLLQNNDKFQQQQQHHRLPGLPTSGLEELILGCTPTVIKGETSIPNTQETEWLKYYWPDPDNPSHQG